MNIGRAVGAAILGFFLFLFLAVDLVLFGVLPLNSVMVTVLPALGLVLGAVLGALVPRTPGLGGAPSPVAAYPTAAAPLPMAVPLAPPPPVAPPMPAVRPSFAPTHTAPLNGVPAWTIPDAGIPPAAMLDPALPVQVLDSQDHWAHVRCENGWEAWVNESLLVPVPAGGEAPAPPEPPAPLEPPAPPPRPTN